LHYSKTYSVDSFSINSRVIIYPEAIAFRKNDTGVKSNPWLLFDIAKKRYRLSAKSTFARMNLGYEKILLNIDRGIVIFGPFIIDLSARITQQTSIEPVPKFVDQSRSHYFQFESFW